MFNALHGRWGEDGCVQGILELLRIPYTHSGLLASALAMDKPVAKQLFAAVGLTCPEGVVVDAEDLTVGDALPRPFVVKPVNEGSSVGVRIVKNGTNLPPVDLDQWPPGTKLLVEKFIAGRELTVAVMGDRPSGGDRDPAAPGLLRLRGQVHRRPRRPRDPGADSRRGL